jgi:hypothetical protein
VVVALSFPYSRATKVFSVEVLAFFFSRLEDGSSSPSDSTSSSVLASIVFFDALPAPFVALLSSFDVGYEIFIIRVLKPYGIHDSIKSKLPWLLMIDDTSSCSLVR